VIPGLPDLTWWRWCLAAVPIALLLVLVLRSRWKMATNALVTLGVAVVVALVAFGAGPAVLAVGLGKGAWTGIWILYVVWAALLLYQIAARGGLDRMGEVFASILPRRIENVLIVAWVFPSFIQGVAGFGTPIAVAAPLLLSMGLSRSKSVVLPLIGYQWSVTFGSMASSFYMGALTAQVTGDELHAYTEIAAVVLAVNAVLSGALVCLVYGGLPALREGARAVVVIGGLMAAGLLVSVQVEPAIGSLAAGACGFAGVGVLRLLSRRSAPAPIAPITPTDGPAPDRDPAPDPGRAPVRPGIVLLPYLLLLVLVLVAFVPTASRTFVRSVLQIGPSFPATETSYGFANEAVDRYTAIGLISHPGSYVLAAAVLGLLTYRLAGTWPRQPGVFRGLLRDWVRQAWRTTISVVALAALATVMVDSGMVGTLALGAAEVSGRAFPVLSPMIGLLGSFTTGSTTSSNALFSALQSDVAVLIDVPPAVLLAAQTAGGNIGNALAPVVILIGASAVGAVDQVGRSLRRVLAPAGVLLAVTTTMTVAWAALA
jgi:lactate permease